jgi:hypothetical protein
LLRFYAAILGNFACILTPATASADLAELVNTHPPAGDRLDRLARKMDGRLDSYASGVDNANRFRQVAAMR